MGTTIKPADSLLSTSLAATALRADTTSKPSGSGAAPGPIASPLTVDAFTTSGKPIGPSNDQPDVFGPSSQQPPGGPLGNVLRAVVQLLSSLVGLLQSLLQFGQQKPAPQPPTLPSPTQPPPTPMPQVKMSPAEEAQYLRSAPPDVQAHYNVMKQSGYPCSLTEANQLLQLGQTGMAKFVLDRLAPIKGALTERVQAKYLPMVSQADAQRYLEIARRANAA
jgi:hypothetical protein